MHFKKIIILFISLCSSFAVAQGNFFNEGTVTVDADAILKIAGDVHLKHRIQGRGEVQMIESSIQHLRGDSLQFHFFSLHKSANKVVAQNKVQIDSAMHFQQGIYEQVADTLFMFNAAFSGGNDYSFVTTLEQGIVSKILNTTIARIPFGADYFHPLELKENGQADTFYFQTAASLFADGIWNSPNTQQQHVANLAWRISDKNLGGNNLEIQFGWNDTQNGAPFAQKYTTPIRFDNTTNRFVALNACPSDVSSMNPNYISATNISEIGIFGIGDSLYLNDVFDLTIQAGTSLSICAGDSAHLLLNPLVVASWSNQSVGDQQWVKNAGNYSASYINQEGCVLFSDTIQVWIGPSPSLPIITRTGNQLSSGVYNTYQWYLDGTAIPGANFSTIVITANGLYTLIVTNAAGCSASSSFVVNNISTEELVSSFILQGPNPANANSWIQIGINNNEAEVIVNVLDVTGRNISQQLFTLTKGINTIPLSFPSDGVFLVTMQVDKHFTKTFKWINVE